MLDATNIKRLMSCYVLKPEFIRRYYVDEAWIDYDKVARRCLRIFHLLDTKGFQRLSKGDLTDAVMQTNNGISDKMRPEVMTYMLDVYQYSQYDETDNVEVYYKDEVKFYVLRRIDHLGMDISQYVDTTMSEGQSIEQMKNYAQATPQSMVESYTNRLRAIGKQVSKCFSYGIETFDLENADVEDERYIINGLLMEHNLAYLTGAAKTGKSFMLEEMLFCVENGISWHGHDVLKTHCLLIDFELTKAKLHKRWNRLKEKYSEIYPSFHFKPYACVSMVGSWGDGNVTLDSIVEFVRDYKREHPELGILALDPFYRFVEGDENSNENVQDTINKLMPLKQDMTVIYTHHTKKNSTDKDPLTNGSGAGSHGRAADISMSLSGDNTKGFHLRYSGREDYGCITLRRDTYGFFIYDATKDSEVKLEEDLDEDTLKRIAEYVGNRVVSMTAFRKKFGNISYDFLRSKGFSIEKEKGNYKIKKRAGIKDKPEDVA